MFQQFIDELDVGVNHLKVLVLGLGGSWVETNIFNMTSVFTIVFLQVSNRAQPCRWFQADPPLQLTHFHFTAIPGLCFQLMVIGILRPTMILSGVFFPFV